MIFYIHENLLFGEKSMKIIIQFSRTYLCKITLLSVTAIKTQQES